MKSVVSQLPPSITTLIFTVANGHGYSVLIDLTSSKRLYMRYNRPALKRVRRSYNRQTKTPP